MPSLPVWSVELLSMRTPVVPVTSMPLLPVRSIVLPETFASAPKRPEPLLATKMPSLPAPWLMLSPVTVLPVTVTPAPKKPLLPLPVT